MSQEHIALFMFGAMMLMLAASMISSIGSMVDFLPPAVRMCGSSLSSHTAFQLRLVALLVM